jgi:hypothetical protein
MKILEKLILENHFSAVLRNENYRLSLKGKRLILMQFFRGKKDYF